jgi:chromosome segregation ATPase
MSDAVSIDPTLISDEGGPLLEKYRSRPRQLARWLLESRDTLREKYQSVKIDVKGLKVRVSDVTKSRDNWRQQAEASEQQVRAMKAEVERLTALLEQASDSGSPQKKVSSRPVP